MASLAELPLSELLGALAERLPAPGGGCTAAWAGSLAAALLQMVAALAGSETATERARALRAQLLEAGEAERHSYEPVLKAMRLPATDPARRPQVDEALSYASDTPLAITRAAAVVAELAAQLARESKPAVRGDAVASVLLAEAATRSAARLVEINLKDHASDPRLAEVIRLSENAARAPEQALGEPRD